MYLYHGEPNGGSARLLITIAERGLDVPGELVDLLAPVASSFSSPDDLRISLPMLVVGGQPLSGETFVCEYLEEACPAVPLLPTDPRNRWLARSWCKLVDDGFGASVSDLAHVALLSTGVPGTLPAERIEAAEERVTMVVDRAERQLETSEWLAGRLYSLADIAIFAYANYLPRVAPALVDPARFPKVNGWLSRVAGRAAVRAALAQGATSDPYAVSTVGPDYIRWG
ncbi:MAG: glutathione S-transferase family protein [Sphingomonas sp.]|nr:glutathione S-transferase family protein [Sphingomonas sp.]